MNRHAARIKLRKWEAEHIEALARVSRYVHKRFSGKTRKWGPSEVLPITHHLTEVALILSPLDLPVEIVISALLHDMFEDYALPGDELELEGDTLEERLKREAEREGLERELYAQLLEIGRDMATLGKKWADKSNRPQRNPDGIYDDADSFAVGFAERIIGDIWALTEPPKTKSTANYKARKMKYLANLQVASTDVAAVSCAAKISGMFAALKHYQCDSLSWSRGSNAENAAMFTELRRIYRRAGVPRQLLELFDTLLEQFIEKGTQLEMKLNGDGSAQLSL